jgi:hypothetical protein
MPVSERTGRACDDQARRQQCRSTTVADHLLAFLMLLWTERRRSKGEQPQESWGSGDGSPASPGSRDPEARADRDVTLLKGVRGDPAIKAWIGSGGFKLWRGEIPRRDRRPARWRACSPRIGVGTDSPRDKGPEDGPASAPNALGRWEDGRCNGRRA